MQFWKFRSSLKNIIFESRVNQLGEVQNKMLSYRRETALQGTLVLAESADWNSETIFY